MPKGVVVGQGALVGHLVGVGERVGLGVGDRLVAVTTVSFDIAVLELFLPLVSGACVVVAGREVVRDPGLLVGLVRGCGATVVQGVPSLWRGLVESGEWPGGVRMLVGGEALPADLAGRMCEVSGGASVVNVYGPTEGAVWATSAEVVGVVRWWWGVRSRRCGGMCWMVGCVRCRWGLLVSCICRVCSWRGVMRVVRG